MLKLGFILVLGIPSVFTSCDLGWEQFNDFCLSFSPEALDWYRAASMCQLYGARLVQVDSAAKHNWIADNLKAKQSQCGSDREVVPEDIRLHGYCLHHERLRLRCSYLPCPTHPLTPGDTICMVVPMDAHFLLSSLSVNETWIGGSNRYHNSSWQWVPSMELFSYTNWYLSEGQPDNSHGENPTNTVNAEQCVQIWKIYDYQWNDRWCQVKMNFVCEKKQNNYESFYQCPDDLEETRVQL